MIFIFLVVVFVSLYSWFVLKPKTLEYGDQVIRTLFLVSDSEKNCIFSNVLIYYPETQKAAVVNIPSNTGAIYQSLNRTDRIDSVFREKGIEVFKSEVEKILNCIIPFYINIELENINIKEEEETRTFNENIKNYDIYKNYKINGLFLGMKTSKNKYLKEFENCSHIETLEHIIERLEEVNKIKDRTKYINYLKNKIKEGYNFIKSQFPETKKEINKITIYDRKEETKSSLQYKKNYDYLNKKYNNNAYTIINFLKDLKIDVYSIDLETLINKGGLK